MGRHLRGYIYGLRVQLCKQTKVEQLENSHSKCHGDGHLDSTHLFFIKGRDVILHVVSDGCSFLIGWDLQLLRYQRCGTNSDILNIPIPNTDDIIIQGSRILPVTVLLIHN